MIIQQEPRWLNRTLKNLRLVHPRFAYLDDILRRLFSRIIVFASSSNLQRSPGTRLDGIAQFIKKIEFHSSINGIDISSVKVLSENGIKAAELTIVCCNATKQMSGWDGLDLSEVKELTFQPDLSEAYYTGGDMELKPCRSCISKGCSELIAKAGGSLERLHLGTLGFAWGADFGELDTPNLRTINLSCTSFDAKPFSQWLCRCHQLERLKMDVVRIAGPREFWLNLFEAIRNMPNAIVFFLHEWVAGTSGGISVVCYTSMQEGHTSSSMAEDDGLLPSIEAFLCGSAEWSPGLDSAIKMHGEDEDQYEM